MRITIKVVTVITLVGFLLTSCSTSGGIYDPKKKDDEFSLKRTIGLVIGVAAAVAVAKNGGGGSGLRSRRLRMGLSARKCSMGLPKQS